MGVIVLRILIFIGVLAGAFFALRALRPRMPAGSSGRNGSNRSGGPNPYEVLGLQRGATIDEIKAAYKRALAQYHPDKVAELGDDLRKLATIRTREIIEAYETLLRDRGV